MTLDELISGMGKGSWRLRRQRCWWPRFCRVSWRLLWLGTYDRLEIVEWHTGEKFTMWTVTKRYWLHREVAMQLKLMVP